MWSYQYIRIVTPERELEGTEFHSNEQMTKYFVSNSIGAFPVSEKDSINDNVNVNNNGNDNVNVNGNGNRNSNFKKQWERER